jgi:oxygen-independent coproporphyrinogen III oxidase
LAAFDIGLYIHVPFCRAKCSYCDFYSITDLGDAGRVVDRTLEDAAASLDALGRPRIDTIYVGGGTPSALPRQDFARLLAGLNDLARGVTPAEFTVEANPETVDREFLDTCAAAGVDRLSIGVQSLAQASLSLLGRRATREQTLAALELAGDAWSGSVSVDLLAGVPGQTQADVAADLEAVLSYRPAHVSLYSLTREPGTAYDARVRAGTLREMAAEEQENVWLRGVRVLRERGYRHYEISNFALDGAECRHNLRYWRLEPYLGAGPAAVSTIPGADGVVVRESRARSVRGYLQRDDVQREEIAVRDFFFETLMMGLRLARGVPVRRVRARFGAAAVGWLEQAWVRGRDAHGTRLRGGTFALTRGGWLRLSGLLRWLLGEIEGLTLEAPPRWP